MGIFLAVDLPVLLRQQLIHLVFHHSGRGLYCPTRGPALLLLAPILHRKPLLGKEQHVAMPAGGGRGGVGSWAGHQLGSPDGDLPQREPELVLGQLAMMARPSEQREVLLLIQLELLNHLHGSYPKTPPTVIQRLHVPFQGRFSATQTAERRSFSCRSYSARGRSKGVRWLTTTATSLRILTILISAPQRRVAHSIDRPSLWEREYDRPRCLVPRHLRSSPAPAPQDICDLD